MSGSITRVLPAETRVLPAEVYDAIQRSADRFGGIGGGSFFEWADGKVIAPVCGIGCAEWPDVDELDLSWHRAGAARMAGVNEDDSDFAVETINARRGGHAEYDRVPFSDWCAEMGVVRGAP